MTENALALIKDDNAIVYFNKMGGLDPVIAKVREEISGIVIDISTKKGREECASLAHKVAKTKNEIDRRGKDLVSEAKAQIKLVDAERNRAWDEMEKIQHEVRAPLTEWEDADKKRIESFETDIAAITANGVTTAQEWQSLPLDAMYHAAAQIESYATKDWQEFASRGRYAVNSTITQIRESIAKREKYDADKAELERLRQEETDRKKREHEERIKSEAAEKARKEAEEKAEREQRKRDDDARIAQEKADREKRDIEEKARIAAESAERERLKLEQEKETERKRAEKAESDRIESEQRAEKAAKAAADKAQREKEEAAEKAKRDKETAVKAERERQAKEEKRKADEIAKREADEAHRDTINATIVSSLMNLGLSGGMAETIVVRMSQGHIPHVKINY